jgi:hypothetical protein
MSKKFELPDKRTEPEYRVDEFVPQHVVPLSDLRDGCDDLDEGLGLARTCLGKVAVPAWEGAAARVFEEYLGEVQGWIDVLRSVVEDTRTALSTAESAVEEAREDADRAVADLNAWQKEQATADEENENLLDRVLDLPDQLGRNGDFADAFGRAEGAQTDVVTALEALATALDAPDAAVAGARVPEPPSAVGLALAGLSPEERDALMLVFGEVDSALEGAGQTRAATEHIDDIPDAVGGSDDDKRDWLTTLAGLSPEELEYVLDHTDEDDIAALLGGLDPDTDREIYNALARSLPLDLQRRLADTDPNHYWHPATGQEGKYGWGDPDGIGTMPDGDTSELQQGGLGDCHVLASLAAMEQAQPGFLEGNVELNPNGTYTVTLYKDGEPIEVVVTPEFPFTVGADGELSDSAYAHDGTSGSEQVNLYTVYEKALAQVWGEVDPTGEGQSGYPGMDGGWPMDDMPVISDTEMDQNEPPSDLSYDDFTGAISDGRPVTLTTKFDPDVDDNPIYADDGDNQAVGGHVYYVIDVQGEPPDAVVTLGNPWGADLPGTGTLTLSWEEVQDQFHSVQVGR